MISEHKTKIFSMPIRFPISCNRNVNILLGLKLCNKVPLYENRWKYLITVNLSPRSLKIRCFKLLFSRLLIIHNVTKLHIDITTN